MLEDIRNEVTSMINIHNFQIENVKNEKLICKLRRKFVKSWM